MAATFDSTDQLNLIVGNEQLDVIVQYQYFQHLPSDSYLYTQFVTYSDQLKTIKTDDKIYIEISPQCSSQGFVGVLQYIRYAYPAQSENNMSPQDLAKQSTDTLFSMLNGSIEEQQQLFGAFDYCLLVIDKSKLFAMAIDTNNIDYVRHMLQDSEYIPSEHHLELSVEHQAHEITRQLILANTPVNGRCLRELIKNGNPSLIDLVSNRGVSFDDVVELDYEFFRYMIYIACTESWSCLESYLNHTTSLNNMYDFALDDGEDACEECFYIDFVIEELIVPEDPDNYSCTCTYDNARMYAFHTLRIFINHISKYVFKHCCLTKLKSLKRMQRKIQYP